MRKNSFLARMEAQKEAEKLQVLRFTRQLITDMSVIALNNAFGFGAERLKKYTDEMLRVYEQYADIWNADTKDTEYSRAALDAKLKQICGEYFLPWEERYG